MDDLGGKPPYFWKHSHRVEIAFLVFLTPIKQLVFHGKYPRVLFVAHLSLPIHIFNVAVCWGSFSSNFGTEFCGSFLKVGPFQVMPRQASNTSMSMTHDTSFVRFILFFSFKIPHFVLNKEDHFFCILKGFIFHVFFCWPIALGSTQMPQTHRLPPVPLSFNPRLRWPSRVMRNRIRISIPPPVWRFVGRWDSVFFFFGLVDFWSMFGRFCCWSMGFFGWDFFGGMDNVM